MDHWWYKSERKTAKLEYSLYVKLYTVHIAINVACPVHSNNLIAHMHTFGDTGVQLQIWSTHANQTC